MPSSQENNKNDHELLNADDKQKVAHIESAVRDILNGPDFDSDNLNLVLAIEECEHKIRRSSRNLDDSNKLVGALNIIEELASSNASDLEMLTELTSDKIKKLETELQEKGRLKEPIYALLELESDTIEDFNREKVLSSINEIKTTQSEFSDEVEKNKSELELLLSKLYNNQNFIKAREYVTFKKNNKYDFAIDHDKKLIKIRRSAHGPSHSILYLDDGDKIVLSSKVLGTGACSRVKEAEYYDQGKETTACKIIEAEYETQQLDIKPERKNLELLNLFRGTRSCYRDKKYIVMKKVSGETLEAALENSKYDQKQKLNMILLSANALQAFHDRGLVHTDIKFDNFIYNHESATSELIDFAQMHKLQVNNDDCTAVVPGIYGSREFMANDGFISKRYDIYAFGVMLKVLVCDESGAWPQELMTIAENLCKPYAERSRNLKEFIDYATKYLGQLNKPKKPVSKL